MLSPLMVNAFEKLNKSEELKNESMISFSQNYYRERFEKDGITEVLCLDKAEATLKIDPSRADKKIIIISYGFNLGCSKFTHDELDVVEKLIEKLRKSESEFLLKGVS